MTKRLLGSLAFAFSIGAPAWTHHNMSALFDFNDVVTQSGNLSEIDWRNPHIYLFLDVGNDDVSERWSFEGPPPGFFRNRDVDRETFEGFLGQAVTVVASHARDGSASGLIREVTLPDGTVVSACPQNC